VRLEASTKPHVHKKIHEFLINMASTMACPNFKKGLKKTFGHLGVNKNQARKIVDTKCILSAQCENELLV
jgi:hypothetical protein